MKNKKVISFILVAALSIGALVFTLLPQKNQQDVSRNQPGNTDTESNETNETDETDETGKSDQPNQQNDKSPMDKLEEAIRKALKR
jgi:hypothetical protein